MIYDIINEQLTDILRWSSFVLIKLYFSNFHPWLNWEESLWLRGKEEVVPGDNLMKMHKKRLRNLTTAFVTTHYMISVERASFLCLLSGVFSAAELHEKSEIAFPWNTCLRQYYCKLKKKKNKLKHKLTHALGISPTLAPSKHDRRAPAACVSQSGLPPTSQAQRGTINMRSHHLQLGEYLRTRSLNFSREVQRGHSLD